MAETKSHPRPSSGRQRIINLVGDHRVNDLTYGHVGRLTYFIPKDDQKHEGQQHNRNSDTGTLYTNRVTESTRSFQEVLPFTAWHPASKSLVEKTDASYRVHMAWLLKNNPDSLVGISGPMTHYLANEVAVCKQMKPFQARLPLLACGEITDARERQLSSCPALAMAAGDSGHILRIVHVREQHCQWPNPHRASIKLGLADSMEEGHWCGEGPPISQIKFASVTRSATPTRWLLVQTLTATHIFQPRLLRTPKEAHHAACGYIAPGPTFIAANPIAKIDMAQTGGLSHSDVAFNAGSDSEVLELAIIDEGGNWSIWDLQGKQTARKMKLVPVMRAQGNFKDEMPKTVNLASAFGLGYLHRIAWFSKPSGKPGMAAASEAGSSMRSDMLLLSNAAVLRILDAQSKNMLCTLNITRHNGLDTILDVQSCPTKTSRIFVLTATNLIWLDLDECASTVNKPRPSASDEKPANTNTNTNTMTHPVVILSCPHLRSPSDRSLKLSVTSSTPSAGGAEWLVCVYSLLHAEVTAFSLSEPAFGREATYERQLLWFAPPGSPQGQKRLGEQALLVLPRAVDAGQGSPGDGYAGGDFDFFQVIALGRQLDLLSALWVRKPSSTAKVASPCVPELDKKRYSRKKDVVQQAFRKRFVVPDGFDASALAPTLKAKVPQLGKEGPGEESLSRWKPSVCDLSAVFALMKETMEMAAEDAHRAVKRNDQYEEPPVLHVIRRIVEAGLDMDIGRFPYATLLYNLDHWYVARFPATLSELSWTQQLAALGPVEEGRVDIFNGLREGGHGSGQTVYEAMARLCMADGDESETADVHRGLVAYASVQLFFSQISMVVHPRPETDSGTTTPRPYDVMSARSTPVPADDMEGRYGREEDFTSSPPSVAWLPSSQEGMDEANEVEEDATIARLRLYAVSIRTERARDEPELRLLSHWQVGADPWEFQWVPAGNTGGAADEEKRREEEEARKRRQKRNEKKAMRERERLLRLMGESGGIEAFSSPAVPRIMHSHEPPTIRSSQAMPMSSQMSNPMSSQVFSSQIGSSQAVPRVGQQVRSKKQKARVARAFR